MTLIEAFSEVFMELLGLILLMGLSALVVLIFTYIFNINLFEEDI